MKPHTHFILQTTLLMACIKVQSQTLTCQYNCPKIGESFSVKTASPVIHTGGLNQLWDFSNVYAVNTFFTYSYLDAGSVASSSLFPQADVVRQAKYTSAYLETGNSGIKFLLPSSTTVSAYSLLLPLPFSYGSTHSETISTINLSGSDVIATTTTKNLEGVGTGTLILPTGTYTDVLRIQGTAIQSQTKNGDLDGPVVTSYLNYYYSAKISHPLLYSRQMMDTDETDYGPEIEILHALSVNITDGNTIEHKIIRVWPNPTSGRICLMGTKGGEVVTLFDSMGRELFNKVVDGVSTEMNVAELAEGIYNLRSVSGGSVQNLKIVVVH